jgi:hypothetical protein
MLRTTFVRIASALALGLGLASPAGAMSAHMGGGSAMHSVGGIALQGAGGSRGGMTAMRSNSWPGGFARHDMGRMRMGDRDHDRGRHDHFRFFPAFAFGVNTYADVYDPSGDCWELHRIWTHAGWRLRRLWVCN